jgi:hypothetical protein
VCKKLCKMFGGRMWAESDGDDPGFSVHFTIRTAGTSPIPIAHSPGVCRPADSRRCCARMYSATLPGPSRSGADQPHRQEAADVLA